MWLSLAIQITEKDPHTVEECDGVYDDLVKQFEKDKKKEEDKKKNALGKGREK